MANTDSKRIFYEIFMKFDVQLLVTRSFRVKSLNSQECIEQIVLCKS